MFAFCPLKTVKVIHRRSICGKKQNIVEISVVCEREKNTTEINVIPIIKNYYHKTKEKTNTYTHGNDHCQIENQRK